MRTEDLIESVPTELPLSTTQVTELRAVGRRLASATSWWGDTDDDSEPPTQRSVISCEQLTPSRAKVTVRDAIGVVSAAGVQLNVHPKIPLHHFLYLAEQSQLVPRLDEQRAQLALGENLWELMAQWFLSSLEAVIRGDLIRDYHSHVEERPFSTGRVVALPTARAYYSGRLAFTCEYELFDTDTPINRVLKAAATTVLANPRSSPDTRKLARRLIFAMDDVGRLRAGDADALPDPRMHRYRDAHLLARQLLRGQLRQLDGHSGSAAWAFLLRTPDLIEAGIRNVLADHLAPHHRVHKTGKLITGTKLRLMPDLVFDDDLAVADVKYKLTDGSWHRGDLYQTAAFALGFRTELGAVVSFDDRNGGAAPAEVRLGDVFLRSLRWQCNDVSPSHAAMSLAEDCLAWLSGEPGPAPSIQHAPLEVQGGLAHAQ